MLHGGNIPPARLYMLIFLVEIPTLLKDYKTKFPQIKQHKNIQFNLGIIATKSFVYTGKVIENGWGVERRTNEFIVFLDNYMQKNPPRQQGSDAGDHRNLKASNTTSSNIESIIEKARNAKNSKYFKELYDSGNLSNFKNDDSKGIQELCNMLAFWFNGSPSTINEAFCTSALYLKLDSCREKWESEDYRNVIILKSIDQCKGDFYKPSDEPKTEQSPTQSQSASRRELLTIEDLSQYLQDNGISIRYNEIRHENEITGLEDIYGREQLQDTLPVHLLSELQSSYKNINETRI